MEKIEKLVGKKIKERRLEKGMSQTGLARNAKTSLTTINRLENGKQFPHSNTLVEIAKALDMDQAEIFGSLKSDSLGGSQGRSDLILAIQARLTTLDESQLRTILDVIDTYPAAAALAASSAGVESARLKISNGKK